MHTTDGKTHAVVEAGELSGAAAADVDAAAEDVDESD